MERQGHTQDRQWEKRLSRSGADLPESSGSGLYQGQSKDRSDLAEKVRDRKHCTKQEDDQSDRGIRKHQILG
jgi:hypothetical protein